MAIFGRNEYFNVSEQNGTLPKHIKGVICDVKNCVYHDGDGFCTANRIKIGPEYANRSSETVCGTFKEKQM